MKRHIGTNESNAALPKWTLVETRDTPCFNAALGSCEIAPISSSAHLAFIKIDITFHARSCLCGRFSVVTIHMGLIKEEYCWITRKYLHDNTMWYYVCAAGSVLCFARIVQMQDFITSLFSWVSNDTGLTHRCNADMIWITSQVVLQKVTPTYIHLSAAPEYATTTGERKFYREKMCQCWTFLIGNSHSFWHVWITHKAQRIKLYVILVLLNSNQMSLAV